VTVAILISELLHLDYYIRLLPKMLLCHFDASSLGDLKPSSKRLLLDVPRKLETDWSE
jgi:hypothetical protein